MEAATGIDFSLLLPAVNTSAMNEFLKQMSHDLGDTEALIVMDCAGWHQSKALNVPKNIEIIYLPPYSPELNPVEKLWQYIKAHTIKNKIYETIEDLENSICDFIVKLDPRSVAETCSLRHCLS